MRKADKFRLKTCIRQTCLEEQGRVLIPSFANQRTQMLLTYIYEIFGEDPDFDVPVLIDSPMACNISDIYSTQLHGEDLERWENAIHWKNVHFINDNEESKNWRDSGRSAVIISSPGMLMLGRSLAWSLALLPREKDRILFCGYSAENSVASIIKEGKHYSYITIGGKRVPNKCQINDLKSFTSHIQRDSMLDYYSSVDCEKIILVHGEMQGKIDFAKELRNKISQNNLTSKVVVAQKDYKLKI